jgi:hypothetical protein
METNTNNDMDSQKQSDRTNVSWGNIDFTQNLAVHDIKSVKQRFIVGSARKAVCSFTFQWQMCAEYVQNTYVHQMKWDLPFSLKHACSTATDAKTSHTRNDFAQISKLFLFKWQLLINRVPVYREEKHGTFTCLDGSSLMGFFTTRVGFVFRFTTAAVGCTEKYAECAVVLEIMKLHGDDVQNSKLASAFRFDSNGAYSGKEEWYIDTEIKNALPSLLTSRSSPWNRMCRSDAMVQQINEDVYRRETKTYGDAIRLSQRIAVCALCPQTIWIAVRNSNHMESVWNWMHGLRNLPVLYGDILQGFCTPSAPEPIYIHNTDAEPTVSHYVHVPRINSTDMARALGTRNVLTYVSKLNGDLFNPALFVKDRSFGVAERDVQDNVRVSLTFAEQTGAHIPACMLKTKVLQELLTLLNIATNPGFAHISGNHRGSAQPATDTNSFVFILDDRGGAKNMQSLQKMMYAWWRILENNVVDMLDWSHDNIEQFPAMWVCKDREDAHDEVTTTCIFVYNKSRFRAKIETFLQCITKASVVHPDRDSAALLSVSLSVRDINDLCDLFRFIEKYLVVQTNVQTPVAAAHFNSSCVISNNSWKCSTFLKNPQVSSLLKPIGCSLRGIQTLCAREFDAGMLALIVSVNPSTNGAQLAFLTQRLMKVISVHSYIRVLYVFTGTQLYNNALKHVYRRILKEHIDHGFPFVRCALDNPMSINEVEMRNFLLTYTIHAPFVSFVSTLFTLEQELSRWTEQMWPFLQQANVIMVTGQLMYVAKSEAGSTTPQRLSVSSQTQHYALTVYNRERVFGHIGTFSYTKKLGACAVSRNRLSDDARYQSDLCALRASTPFYIADLSHSFDVDTHFGHAVEMVLSQSSTSHPMSEHPVIKHLSIICASIAV